MRKIVNCIKNLFKVAKILSVDDSGNFQFATVSYLGKSQQIMLFTPYGIINHPPHSSMTLLWSQQGQESNGIGIADDPKTRPLRDLVEGEVALVNHLTGDYVYLKENGNCEVSVTGDLLATVGGSTSLTAAVKTDIISPEVNIKTDALNVTNSSGGETNSNFNGGASFVGGSVTHDSKNIGSTHAHSGVQTGPGNTGGPV